MFRNLFCVSKKKGDPPKKPEKNYIEYIVQKDLIPSLGLIQNLQNCSYKQ